MQNELQYEYDLFNKYYSNYNDSLYGIKMKYEHTIRVMEYAKDIAVNELLSYPDYLIAIKCALFHDIARFKQWDTYQTFEDGKSFDHGDEGYNILKELGYNDEIVLQSTKYHNKKEVGSEVDDRTRLFCNITRDADKLDIMATQGLICQGEFILTDDIIDAFKDHRLVTNNPNYEHTDAFYIYRMIAFIFDLNFKRSLEIVKNRNIISDKFALLRGCCKDPNQLEILKELENICNKYIDERISD